MCDSSPTDKETGGCAGAEHGRVQITVCGVLETPIWLAGQKGMLVSELDFRHLVSNWDSHVGAGEVTRPGLEGRRVRSPS